MPLKIGKGEGLRELNFSKLRESLKRKGGGGVYALKAKGQRGQKVERRGASG